MTTRSVNLAHRVNALLQLDSDSEQMRYEGVWYKWNDIRSIAARTRTEVADLPADASVGVICRNHPFVLAVVLGLLADRRCVLPFPALVGDRHLSAEVSELRPTAVFVSDADWDRPGLVETIRAVGARCVRVPAAAGSPLAPAIMANPSDSTIPAVTYPQGTAFVLQTSGTTGKPKRVPVSYRNIEASIASMQARVAKGQDPSPEAPRLRQSVAIINTPVSHTSGMLAFTLNTVEGRRLVLMDKFEPVVWSALVRDNRVASAGVPPAALMMLLDADIPPAQLASLKVIRSGTAPLDPELAVRFEKRFGIPVIQAYGATEFQGIASWSLQDYREWGEVKRGSVGRPHAGVDLRITDPDTGEIRPPGQPGRLLVRSEQSSVRSPDGWVPTNDIARIDEDGFLWIVGRTDDIINRGGLKVDSVAVADALEAHPWIASATVVGVPDARLGEIPCAAVVLSPDLAQQPRPELTTVLRAHLRDLVSPYMIPGRFIVVDAMPLNATMKIDRPAVKALFG